MLKRICFLVFALALLCLPAQARMVDNGDGTVTDTITGLTWQQAESYTMNWEEALAYCEVLGLAGYDDWRLPNTNELQSIVDYKTKDPAIDTSFFPDAISFEYWSSTTRADRANLAWTVSFGRGIVYTSKKNDEFYVRAVRGGQ